MPSHPSSEERTWERLANEQRDRADGLEASLTQAQEERDQAREELEALVGSGSDTRRKQYEAIQHLKQERDELREALKHYAEMMPPMGNRARAALGEEPTDG